MKTNNLEFKLKTEKFIKEALGQYSIIIAFLCLCAWLFDKPIEAIMFCVAHVVIRRNFDKQYHCSTNSLCMCLTLTIGFFGIAVCLPLSISLLSAIPLCFMIAEVGYMAQDRLDLIVCVKQTATKHKDIYAMNEQELYEHCRNRGLDDADCKIAKLLVIDRLKGEDLYYSIGYSESQAKRKRKKILNLIK